MLLDRCQQVTNRITTKWEKHTNTQCAPWLDFNRAVSMQAASEKSWNNFACTEHWKAATVQMAIQVGSTTFQQPTAGTQVWTEVLHERSQGWPGCVDDAKTWGNQDQGSSPQASEPYESQMLRLSSKNLGRSSRTSVPTTASPEATNLQRLVCKMPTPSVNMLKSMCWIRKVLLDCSGASVSSRWCSAPRHLNLKSFWQSLLGTTWPCPHKSHSVTSSLATLALMCLQQLRSDQRCRSSKIIHSGGKQSPEDLLTRPHCWKDSGPRLVVNQ